MECSCGIGGWVGKPRFWSIRRRAGRGISKITAKPDARFEIPIEIKNVENCYAFDVELRYDPQVLSMEDADPMRDGVQPALGTFLDAGMVLYNTVDTENGIIRFVMSQMNPSEPKSGSGVLVVLYMKGLKEGESALEMTRADLSTREGQLIPTEMISGSVQISANAVQSAATAIPVQDPTAIMMIPTLAPTSTPTTVPTKAPATPTSVPEVVAAEETQPPQAGAAEQNGNDAQKSGTPIFVWVLAGALVLAGGVGLIARRVKKSIDSTNEEER
jgi:Cohesin domain.